MEEVKAENNTAKKYGIIITAVLLILGFIVLYEWKNFESYKPVVIGSPAPDFELKDLNKKSVRLSDYKGKVVFLNFWATWCKPCKEEMPAMELLYKALKGKDFEMIAVSIDRDISKVEPFVKELKLTFPIVLDFMGKADRRYKLTGVPETYIIDQNGVIVEKILGPRDWTRPESIGVVLELLKKEEKK
ncbi:MAG: TlpA disulfide reductase family protein [Nitrospirota bacterium]